MSGQILAVWGSPHAGKTTFSTKLGECLCHKTHASVVILYADLLTPAFSVLFPNRRRQELCTVGDVLSQTDIYANDVVSHLVTRRECRHLGYLGYCNGENRYSFPEYHEQKAESLLDRLCEVADYVVVDCVSDTESSLLSLVALQKADTVIKLCTPQLSCIGFYQSQSSLAFFKGLSPKHELRLLNLPEAELEARMGDVGRLFEGISGCIPYSQVLKEQYLEGEITSVTKDKRYREAMEKLAEAVR